jgi:hypothetical protein
LRDERLRVCCPHLQVWNPCFDVTPGHLIEGIITEEGVVPRDVGSGRHAVDAFVAARQQQQQQQQQRQQQQQGAAGNGAAAESSSSVRALDAAGVVSFISSRPALAARVGPPGSEGQWSVEEVGDGNINFVFIVQVRRRLRKRGAWHSGSCHVALGVCSATPSPCGACDCRATGPCWWRVPEAVAAVRALRGRGLAAEPGPLPH